MGNWTIRRSHANHIADRELRARLDSRHAELDLDCGDDDIVATFYQDKIAVAVRAFRGFSNDFVIDAAENWCSGILNSGDFTMEERLKA